VSRSQLLPVTVFRPFSIAFIANSGTSFITDKKWTASPPQLPVSHQKILLATGQIALPFPNNGTPI